MARELEIVIESNALSVALAITAFSEKIEETFNGAFRDMGEVFITRVATHIRKQDLKMAPLSPRTVAKKTQHERDKWIESEFFIDHLENRLIEEKDGISIKAGAFTDVKHTPSGKSMGDLAALLEYGSIKIPARPLFTPTLDEMEPVLIGRLEQVAKKIKGSWYS